MHVKLIWVHIILRSFAECAIWVDILVTSKI